MAEAALQVQKLQRLAIELQESKWANLDIWTVKAPDHSYLDVNVGSAVDMAAAIQRNYKDVDLTYRLKNAKDMKVAYITAFNVKTPGQGLGTRIMERALKLLDKLEVSAVFLHALADPGHERDLERFYMRHGFRRLSGHGIFAYTMPAFWRKL